MKMPRTSRRGHGSHVFQAKRGARFRGEDTTMRQVVRLSALWLGLLVCGHLFAQGGNGSISGTATDQSGAVVPNLGVIAKNVATGVVSRATTGSVGVYNFPTL